MNLNDLYKKVSDFEASQTKEFKESLACKSGCDRCCYVDLSIFQIEANNIINWLSILSNKDKHNLKEKLLLEQEAKVDFEGNTSSPCVFLKQDKCQIYPVRPLICRTQGNPFAIKQEDKSFIDICPLNEDALKKADKNDIINLELLNTILTQLNSIKGYEAERVKLAKIKEDFLKN